MEIVRKGDALQDAQWFSSRLFTVALYLKQSEAFAYVSSFIKLC